MVDGWWVLMDSRQELEDLRYEYDKAVRIKASLEKNYERRKKLNLLDENEEESIKDDLKDVSIQIDNLRSKVRRLESQKMRSRVIAETNEKSPWEN